MGSLYHPTTGFGVRVAVFDEPLFDARFYARIVMMLVGNLAGRISHVAGIQAEILLVFPPRNLRTLNDDLNQRLIQQLGVVKIGAADGDRQRGSTAVY